MAMSKMYESLMEGLMEDLHDIQEHGEPQGRKTVIEYSSQLSPSVLVFQKRL